MPNEDHFVSSGTLFLDRHNKKGSEWYRSKSKYFIGANTRAQMQALSNDANRKGGKEVGFLLSYNNSNRELAVNSLGTMKNATTNGAGSIGDAVSAMISSNPNSFFVAFGHTHTTAGAKHLGLDTNNPAAFHNPSFSSNIGSMSDIEGKKDLVDYAPMIGYGPHPSFIISPFGYSMYTSAYEKIEAPGWKVTYGTIYSDSNFTITQNNSIYDFNGVQKN